MKIFLAALTLMTMSIMAKIHYDNVKINNEMIKAIKEADAREEAREQARKEALMTEDDLYECCQEEGWRGPRKCCDRWLDKIDKRLDKSLSTTSSQSLSQPVMREPDAELMKLLNKKLSQIEN
jgi:hypothetical protein